MTRIVTIDLDSLDSNDQRSFSMLRRTKGWGQAVRESRKVSEPVTPIVHKTTAIKAAKNTRRTVARDTAKVTRHVVTPEVESTKLRKAAIAELLTLLSGGVETPAPVKATKPKAKATKRDDFYEEVIVKGYAKRAAAKPYKCEEPSCYKFGHRFTAIGWFGTKTSNGHIDIAAAHK